MNRPVAGPNQGDSIQQWYADIPIVTKILFTGTFLMGCLVTFGMVTPDSVFLIWPFVTKDFEFWRLFTNFFFTDKFSFNFVMHLYILYENSLRYERNPYDTGAGGTSADYLFMILIAMPMIWMFDYFNNGFCYSDSLLYIIMYVWSRREPESQLNIFGFKFQSVYLPWVYIAIRLLMGGSIMMPIIGIIIGHSYFFLIEVLPGQQPSLGSIIRTPQWCVRIGNFLLIYICNFHVLNHFLLIYVCKLHWNRAVEVLTSRSQPRATPGIAAFPPRPQGGVGVAPPAAAAARGGTTTYNWGRGNVLGRS